MENDSDNDTSSAIVAASICQSCLTITRAVFERSSTTGEHHAHICHRAVTRIRMEQAAAYCSYEGHQLLPLGHFAAMHLGPALTRPD